MSEYTKEQAIEFLEKIGHTDPSTHNEELCKCGLPIHPCVACEEVIEYYNKVDSTYFELVKLILEEGRVKKNRTGTDTIGVFGAQAKYDVDLDAFPILTTKKVFFKGIVHELLWFISGSTNIKYLVDNDVHIWDEWAYKRYMQYWDKNGCSITHEGAKIGMDIGARSHRPFTQIEFINNIKGHAEFAIQFGELGEGTYGGMWRAFPYSYEAPEFEYGAQKGSEIKTGQVDQLQKVIDKLKTNPDDRRLIVSAWHPYWVDHCALPPCHCLFHFNTEELTLDERKRLLHEYHWPKDKFPDKIFAGNGIKAECDDANIPTRRLNCLLYQRSNDTALGIPFNITSYALLTAMVAQCVGMVPGIFTHSHGDLHIYQNHVVGLKEQMTRLPRKLPSLWINPKVKNLFDFKYDDIKLVGYDPHPTIKFDVAV